MEHRSRAVLEVLDGTPVAEVARQYGASRQSVHTWLRRFQAQGRAVGGAVPATEVVTDWE